VPIKWPSLAKHTITLSLVKTDSRRCNKLHGDVCYMIDRSRHSETHILHQNLLFLVLYSTKKSSSIICSFISQRLFPSSLFHSLHIKTVPGSTKSSYSMNDGHLNRINPQPPLAETDDPQLELCITRPHGITVLPNETWDPSDPLVVDVMKASGAKRAYMRIRSLRPKSLNHHAPGWGWVYFAVVLRKVGHNTFQYPAAESIELVAIKRLSKPVVRAELDRMRRENPYKEIQRMQRYGDNIHVLGLTEEGALHDENYLYLIMPFGQSLVDIIPWNREGFNEPIASLMYENILQNVRYLHENGICHRDLSPDNCLVVRGRIVFVDLAMSFLIPPGGYVTALGGFGKKAYLPPEICYHIPLPFEAKACDLWSSMMILFNLLVAEILWREPSPDDLLFRYFVLAEGISRIEDNERITEILMGLDADSWTDLRRVVVKTSELSLAVRDLLGNVLKASAIERWETHDVFQCPWMVSYRQQMP
jgi:hypothetical protein